eukprot:745995-Amphidinium_carterae.1
MVASGFFVVADTAKQKSKELNTDIHEEEHYRNNVLIIEKDARYTSSSGEDTRRRKVKERKAFQVMTREDHWGYSKLISLESLKEEDPIPSWALEMKAPNAPI